MREKLELFTKVFFEVNFALHLCSQVHNSTFLTNVKYKHLLLQKEIQPVFQTRIRYAWVNTESWVSIGCHGREF